MAPRATHTATPLPPFLHHPALDALSSLFLYLAPLIIPHAVVSFDYETRSGSRARALARSHARAGVRVCLPADPMCCTTPSGIAPSRRGRIARYNGPLHNGIRTCAIYTAGRCRRRRCRRRRDEARRCLSGLVAGPTSGDRAFAGRGISPTTRRSRALRIAPSHRARGILLAGARAMFRSRFLDGTCTARSNL